MFETARILDVGPSKQSLRQGFVFVVGCLEFRKPRILWWKTIFLSMTIAQKVDRPPEFFRSEEVSPHSKTVVVRKVGRVERDEGHPLGVGCKEILKDAVEGPILDHRAELLLNRRGLESSLSDGGRNWGETRLIWRRVSIGGELDRLVAAFLPRRLI